MTSFTRQQPYSYSCRVKLFNNVLRGIMQCYSLSEKIGYQLRSELSATVVR